MIYLWVQNCSMVDFHPKFGVLVNPSRRGIKEGIKEGRRWALDNGAYSEFDAENFMVAMEEHKNYLKRCIFVVAPDVVGDAESTLRQYPRWREIIRQMGYPVAFVAQDGQEGLEFPRADCLFIGGTTKWKMGEGAAACIEWAKKNDVPVHVGRINSWRRYEHFRSLGACSCDGTHPIYEPNTARERITSWFDRPYNLNLFGSNHRR